MADNYVVTTDDREELTRLLDAGGRIGVVRYEWPRSRTAGALRREPVEWTVHMPALTLVREV